MIGYDIDGVLCEGPPQPPKAWGRMNGVERRARRRALVEWYESAPPLLEVTEPFIAITARKGDADVTTATMKWMRRNAPACTAVHFLGAARSLENIVEHKAAAINNADLTDYTDDGLAILRKLVHVTTCRLWVWTAKHPVQVAIR